ncbi:MAG: SRPBCC family protein [Elusimicrobiota bacterium]
MQPDESGQPGQSDRTGEPARPAGPTQTEMPAGDEKVVSSVTVAVEVSAPAKSCFAVAANHFNLPKWAHPIKEVRLDEGRREVDYLLPDGIVTCQTQSRTDMKRGVVDWTVRLPKGEPIQVFSRVVPLDPSRSVYIFTLLSPPMPRRRLKDAYGVVEKNLVKDLEKFRELVRKESQKGPDALEAELQEAQQAAGGGAPTRSKGARRKS